MEHPPDELQVCFPVPIGSRSDLRDTDFPRLTDFVRVASVVVVVGATVVVVVVGATVVVVVVVSTAALIVKGNCCTPST